MRSWPQTVISQYTRSPRLLALLGALDEWIDPSRDLEAFYQLVWDIEREGGAQGYGLDVWGRIVGVSRVVQFDFGSYFGFEEARDRTGFSGSGYTQGSFEDGQKVVTTFTVDDKTYRYLIFAKAALNITNASVPAINQTLMSLFPSRGNAYVLDGSSKLPALDQMSLGPLTAIYVFEFPLEPIEIAIVASSGVLPRPAGVRAGMIFAAA